MMTTDAQPEVTGKQMRRALEQRRAALDRANHVLWQCAKRDFEAIVTMIKQDFHPERIYCWGSLLKPEKFNDMSDIDIGVEGIIDPATFFRLLGKASEMTKFCVDMVQMEKISPIYAGLIRRKGMVIYDGSK